MSLDVYLTLGGQSEPQKEPAIYVRDDGRIRQISRKEWDTRNPGREPVVTRIDDGDVFTANITHNLNRMAAEAGVKIALGTDCGFQVAHGENAVELEQFVQGGFTPMEAIVAATQVGAELLDLKDCGTVEPGKLADLVVVDGDPLQDIRILQDETKIAQVYKGGQAMK